MMRTDVRPVLRRRRRRREEEESLFRADAVN